MTIQEKLAEIDNFMVNRLVFKVIRDDDLGLRNHVGEIDLDTFNEWVGRFHELRNLVEAYRNVAIKELKRYPLFPFEIDKLAEAELKKIEGKL